MHAPDRVDTARHALGQVLTHPATWAPFLPVAGAYAFLGVPWWVCFPLLMVMVAVVFLAWSRQWPGLMDKARTELLAAYCSAENEDLAGRIVHLAQAKRRAASGHLLDSLRQAMEIRKSVEHRLFADGTITAHEQEVGAMVGELVRTMVQELERLSITENEELTPAAAERFEKAAETLRRVCAEIDVILDPVPEDLRLPAEDDALSRASERLNDKLVQARGVRRHLEQGMIIHDSPPAEETVAPNRPAGKQPTAEG